MSDGVIGEYLATPPTLTDRQQQNLRLASDGSLMVSGGTGGGAATIADGADVAEGSTTDAVVAAGAAGTVSAKLRRLTTDIGAITLQLPASLGAKTGALSLSVVPNTDTAFPVSGTYISGGYSAQTTGTFGPLKTDQYYNLRTTVAVTAIAGIDAFSNASIGVWAGTAASTQNLLAGIAPHLFNGTAWDRQRGDVNGAVTQPHALVGSRVAYVAASGGISNTTTAVTILAPAGASTRNYVTALQISWGTLGAGTEVAIRDGAAGTVLWRAVLPTTAGSMSMGFALPLRGTANTLLEVVTLTATVSGAVYVNAQGFTSTV